MRWTVAFPMFAADHLLPMAVPWYFYGGDPNELQLQLDSLARFADEVITRF